MEKEELKKQIITEIDRHKDMLIELGKSIWQEAEAGYEEFKTAGKVEKIFRDLNLPVKNKLARTGVRGDFDTGREGPAVAILGELDALIMPEHPEANPDNHAAHACGHNMQISCLCGAALGLCSEMVRKELSGRVVFIACPAEECRIERFEGIRYLGGKPELIRQGVFDDVDMAMMTHAGTVYGAAESSNGFVMKKVYFYGNAAHAGHPWAGVNALSAARSALSAVDMQRDIFTDDDTIRIHGIIEKGGSVVNIVPEEVILEYQIRGKTPEAFQKASMLFDRCMQGAALAFGVKVEIKTYAGYLSLNNNPDLLQLHVQNLQKIKPAAEFRMMGHRTSSTDMGDISMIMPAIHPYGGGWTGIGHTPSYHWTDETESFVEPAKVLAMNAVDLLYGDAEKARQIKTVKPHFTRQEYLDFLDQLDRTVVYDYSGK